MKPKAPKKGKRIWKPSDCRKQNEGCYCLTGYDYEDQCPDCRDSIYRDAYSYCVCPPLEKHKQPS